MTIYEKTRRKTLAKIISNFWGLFNIKIIHYNFSQEKVKNLKKYSHQNKKTYTQKTCKNYNKKIS